MTDDTLQLLLEHKLSFLVTVADTTMSWWTTSIVFCAAMIGLFWSYREQVVRFALFHHVCAVVAIFLCSFPYYAWRIIENTGKLKGEALQICIQLGVPTAPLSEFDYVQSAVRIGFWTFFPVILLWAVLWWHLARETKSAGSNTPPIQQTRE